MDRQPDNPQRHSLWPEVAVVLIICATLVALVGGCEGWF